MEALVKKKEWTSRDPLIMAACVILIGLSPSLAGSSWWLVAIGAALIGLVSFFSMLSTN